jgi:putative MATE family efflux protein
LSSNHPSSGNQSKLTNKPSTARKVNFGYTRQIVFLAIPAIVAAQIDNLVGLIDIFMVGKLGAEAVSAVGISRVIIMVISIMMISVSTGAFAMVAQFIGARSPVEASATAKQSITLMIILSVVMSSVGIFSARWSLQALSLAPEVVELATPYLQVFYGGMVFMAVNYCVTNFFYAAGDMRTPLVINSVISVVKIGASYLLIFGELGFPALGVTGAAVGTILGRLCGVILGLSILYSGRFRVTLLRETSYWLDRALARRILRIGIPSALQGLFRNGSGVVFVKLVALTDASTAALAAFSIGNQVERVLRRTSLAFGTAATCMVGQSIGEGKLDIAESKGITTIIIASGSMILMSMGIALMGHSLMEIFTDVDAVIRIGIVYIYAMAIAEPFMSLAAVSVGGLRGAGETRSALYYTIICQWFIRLPVGYLLAFPLGFGINGLWASLVVFSVLQGLLSFRRFLSGAWKKIQV